MNWFPLAKVQQARQAKLIVRKPAPPTRKSPYFVQEVLKELRLTLGISQVAGRGYRVYTTLDPVQQAAAEEAVLRLARDDSEASQAALVAMDTSGHELWRIPLHSDLHWPGTGRPKKVVERLAHLYGPTRRSAR